LILGGIVRLADNMRALAVLHGAGMVDLRHPVPGVRKSLAIRRLGPIAGAAAHQDPQRLALIDEFGGLRYGELDRRANSVARGWATLGLQAGDVVGVLCRNHRGLLDAMIACGKLGACLARRDGVADRRHHRYAERRATAASPR
jgi:fatty-acyl-CoA synthase